jgi:hypothetical protein
LTGFNKFACAQGADLRDGLARLCEPQLQLPIMRFVALHEILEVVGDTVARDIAASLYFAGYLVRKVFRPMLQGVEGNYPDRIAELTRKEIGNDGFRIRPLDFGFTENAAERTKIVHHQIDRLVCAVGDNRRGEVGL